MKIYCNELLKLFKPLFVLSKSREYCGCTLQSCPEKDLDTTYCISDANLSLRATGKRSNNKVGVKT